MNIDDVKHKYDLQVLNEKKVKSGLRAEELREKLDPEAAIRGLLELGNQAKTCNLVDLPRLQFQASIFTTVLRKCMPDLKALEIKEKNNNYTRLIIDMTSNVELGE
jgi:hypothetical protein